MTRLVRDDSYRKSWPISGVLVGHVICRGHFSVMMKAKIAKSLTRMEREFRIQPAYPETCFGSASKQ
jgi:hypothetical protein